MTHPDPAPDIVTVSVDAMSGDRGAPAVIAALARSIKFNARIRFIVHGDESVLTPLIEKRKIADQCTVKHSEHVISMDEKPSHAMRHGKGSTMWNAVQSVKDGEASSIVSCGNTGALMAISMLVLRRAPGIYRPAIAVLWPSNSPIGFNIMLDVGADIRADSGDLTKFALMGASYARNGFGITHPRVGLLNVGTEDHKGRVELHEAHEKISEVFAQTDYEFLGFVEGTDIPSDRVDVIVTDGFTGNIAIKTGEGTADYIGKAMRESFKATLLSRIGALFALTSLSRLKKRVDPRRQNGGVFLGLNGTVVKSHGSADATGISSAIKLAFQLEDMRFSEKLTARVATAAQLEESPSA
ncbi:MAG: phosphate acyltransferase PlsX [Pseudomonadota bacterium]